MRRCMLLAAVPALLLLGGCALLRPGPAPTLDDGRSLLSPDSPAATSAAPTGPVTEALGLTCDDLGDLDGMRLALGETLVPTALGSDADANTLSCGWVEGDVIYGILLDPDGATAAPDPHDGVAVCTTTPGAGTQCSTDATIGDAWVHIAAGGMTTGEGEQPTPELQGLFDYVLGVVQGASS